MKNAFYFTLKSLFVYEIFPFLSWVFGHIGKRLDKKAKVNLKIYGVTNWNTNNYKIHIVRYLKKQRQSDNETWSINQLIEYIACEIFFLKNYAQNLVEKLLPDPFLKDQNWAHLWISSLKFHTVCFYLSPSQGLPELNETNR